MNAGRAQKLLWPRAFGACVRPAPAPSPRIISTFCSSFSSASSGWRSFFQIGFEPPEVAFEHFHFQLGLGAGLWRPPRGARPRSFPAGRPTYCSGPQPAADGRAALVPGQLGSRSRRARGRRLRRARAARRGAARPDPPRRSAVARRTSNRGPRSTGTGGRRTRSGPSSRRSPRPASWPSPGARATAASTTWRSACSRPTCSRSARPSATRSATSCSRATGPTASSADRQRGALVRRRPGDGRPGHPDRPLRPALLAELVEDGRLVPVAVEGVRGERFVLGPSSTSSSRPTARSRPVTRPAASPRAWPSWRRSIRSPGTATCCAACTGSTTSGRCTCPRRSGAGATTCCRCSSATGSSGASSRGSTGGRRPLRVLGLWWEEDFDPATTDGFAGAFAEAIGAHRDFAGLGRVAMPRRARERALAAAVRAMPRAPRRRSARSRVGLAAQS